MSVVNNAVGSAVTIDHTSKSALRPSIFCAFFASSASTTESKEQEEQLKATAAASCHTGKLFSPGACHLRMCRVMMALMWSCQPNTWCRQLYVYQRRGCCNIY